MKKISIVLVIMMLCTGLSFAGTVPTDIRGNVYETAIKALSEKDIITGDVDGKFYPESNLTRAQACIMVVKAINPPTAEITGTATQIVKSGFPDMAGYGWADGYIAYAVKKGVVNGYPDGTFKPGNMVKIEEITAMVLRASGYTNQIIGGSYPSNYMDKAASLGLFEDMFTILAYPTLATKGMTAKIIFNGLGMIEAANPHFQTGIDSGEKPVAVPTLTGKTYMTGIFNGSMTEFAGKPIASNVKVFTYGKKIDYKSTMTMSEDIADYRIDTIYKYKSVNTPLWYAMTDNKISEIILPMDVGFTGYAYGVVNATFFTLNYERDIVAGIETLVAGNSIRWTGTTSLTGVPGSAEYLAGTLYEFRLNDGQIKSIATSETGRDVFVELTEVKGWHNVYSYSNGVVRLDSADGELVAVKDNATVYVLSEDQTEYTTGNLSRIKEERAVRLFDMTDDDDATADIVVVTTMTLI